MGWLKGLRGLSEAEVFRVEASDLPDFGLCEGRIPQRLAGDDCNTRPSGFPEDFVDPLLAKQAERNLEDLGLAGLETKQRFDRLVDGNTVVVELVFRLQRIEDLVG